MGFDQVAGNRAPWLWSTPAPAANDGPTAFPPPRPVGYPPARSFVRREEGHMGRLAAAVREWAVEATAAAAWLAIFAAAAAVALARGRW